MLPKPPRMLPKPPVLLLPLDVMPPRMVPSMLSKPAALVPQGETHEITLRMLPLLSGGIPVDRSFCLRVVGGDEDYLYEDCAVTEHSRDARGDSIVSDTYTLKAHRMTKGRIQDAG